VVEDRTEDLVRHLNINIQNVNVLKSYRFEIILNCEPGRLPRHFLSVLHPHIRPNTRWVNGAHEVLTCTCQKAFAAYSLAAGMGGEEPLLLDGSCCLNADADAGN